MTIRSGFFNSVNGDRRYNAAFFAEYFASFIANGVFPNPATGLQVIEGINMTTIVKPGKGWINGYYINNDSDYVLQHDIADGVLKRIDRVVMRLNHQSRQIEIAIKKGTFSSNPAPPALQRDADAYELALADVFINNGATQITQANITDLRLNNELCGIVHGTVDQVDTTTLFNQYQSWISQQKEHYENDFETWSDAKRAEFDQWMNLEQSDFEAWLESIKDLLDTNIAANLQNQIDRHTADYVAHPGYAESTNVGNVYSVTLSPAPNEYKEGMGLVVKINADSLPEPTYINVNGLGAIPIKKANGGDVKILNANGIYSLRYSAGNFILQGEGGGGTATEADLLEGKTAVSDAGDLIGTMKNNGAVTITPGQSDIIIPQGYHNGQGVVKKVEFDASKVLTGTMIAGKAGTMPNRGSIGTVRPGTSNKTYAAGYYDSFAVEGDSDLIPANIIQGKNIFGVIGTATPESMGGVKYASGTITSSSKIYKLFYGPYAIDYYNQNVIEVNSLNFKPRLIFLQSTSSRFTVYSYLTPEYVNIGRWGGHNNTATYVKQIYMNDSRNEISLFVNNTGFRLPTDGGTYQWLAFG
ncbi:hypothetical protein [Ureibacillus sp. FSL W8-0352]|uniref:hypothetical protein n=1 Tax=Ureibacillus sp. FSL W8-0352 TaxID=2954596 RepID=UPI0030F9558E